MGVRGVDGLVGAVMHLGAICCLSAAQQPDSRNPRLLMAAQKLEALCTAIRSNDVHAARLLIKNDVRCAPDLFSSVCAGGNMELVTLFLEHHVQPNVPDAKGLYPIHHAAAGGHMEVVQLLHTQGVPYEQGTRAIGSCAVHFAARHGHADLVRFLYFVTPERFLTRRATGAGLAHDIAASGNVALMRWYLEQNGAAIDQKDTLGTLPVFMAALNGRLTMLQYLLERKPEQLRVTNATGWPLIAAAAKNNNQDIIAYLRSQGQSLAQADGNRRTIAHIAAKDCYPDLIRQAIEIDEIDPTIRDRRGWSLIHYAAQGGCLETIKLLHKTHRVALDLPVRSERETTVVHIAAAHNHTNLLAYMRDQGLDVSAADKQGHTPLHYARKTKAQHAVAWILRHNYRNRE